MKIVKGNKVENLTPLKFKGKTKKYKEIIIDLGSGDGRFVYTTARENPDTFVIGIDPSYRQLSIYSKKVNCEKISNALFIPGSVENLPKELLKLADRVYINFPWGSLLGGITNADEDIIKNITSLLKKRGEIEIVFGYSQDAEPSEVERLGLSELSEEKIREEIVPVFEKFKFNLTFSSSLNRSDIFEVDSSWGKKLSFGQERKLFKLVFTR